MAKQHTWTRTMVVFAASVLMYGNSVMAQAVAGSLPEGWEGQAIGDFVATMHNAVESGMSDADRAAAAAQWMDANDWQSGSRKHRVQLVELLDRDKLDKQRFSARWTGYLTAERTDDYTLSLWAYYTTLSLETRVWMDGQLVLESTGSGEDKPMATEAIALEAGVRVPIRVEFSFDYHREGATHARPSVILSWKTESTRARIIPGSRFTPPDDYQGEGDSGLLGEYFNQPTFKTAFKPD